MAWRRAAKSSEAAELVASAKATEVAQNVSWVRSLSKNESDELFTSYLSQGSEIIKQVNFLWFFSKKDLLVLTDLHGYLDQIRTAWNEIDVRSVTSEEAETMFKTIHAIPTLLSTFKVRAQAYNSTYAFHNATQNYLDVPISRQLSRLAETLIQIMLDQRGRVPAGFPQARGSLHASAYSKDKDLHAKLVKLEKLWKQAAQVPHSVENQFFLEETARTYVPDALKLYAGFVHVPESIRKDARNMLFQQLGLIEKQLQRLASSSASTNLQGMQAQVDFLKMKVSD